MTRKRTYPATPLTAAEEDRKAALIDVTDLTAITEPEQSVQLEDLLPNPNNPRADWKPEQVENFAASLARFGDLSGIVRNLETDQLVGGHKRVDVFRESQNVEIRKVTQPIDTQGTVAHGYVLVDGHRFAYREVRWTPAIEAAANLAANRWTADWQWQLVSETLKRIDDPELLALTGFPAHELQNLLAAEWSPAAKEDLPADAEHPHTIALSPAQYDLLTQVKAALAEATDAGVVERLCVLYLTAGAP